MSDDREDGLDARIAAHELLSGVTKQKKSFDLLLETNAAYLSLEPRDRAFTRMLTATALRRLGQCDTLIKALQTQEKKALSPDLQNILRLGLTQILFMDVADHAAVDTSVRLCGVFDLPGFKKFVNALLRRTLRERDPLLGSENEVLLNIPQWLIDLWQKDWGEKATRESALASLNEAPLDLTIKDPAHVEGYARSLEGTKLFYNTVRLKEKRSVRDMPDYDDGTWWVQDASAALPAMLFEDLKGRTVIDLCAAPGGKTAQLASARARVIALDRSAKRLVRLSQNMERLGLQDSVEVITSDAAHWSPKEPVDALLLDAPCSATGIIRRHPDILHLKNERDVTALAETQKRIFDHAADMIKPGGTLIYCTCSTLKAEGEDQVAFFLNNHPEYQRDPFRPKEVREHNDLINKNGELRIFPHHLAAEGGMDGFFIARLKKSN